MYLFNLLPSMLALLALTTPTLSNDLERLAHLPTCDASLAGTSLCGSSPSYTNDIFQCTPDTLTWTLTHTCTAANAPCSHGSCTPLLTPCSPGTTKCVTLRSHGYQGIASCQSGRWVLTEECACGEVSGGGIKCVGPKLMGAESGGKKEGCRVGELRCLAENAQGKDGAVFRCNEQGFWRVAMDCTRWERCVERPVPHCTWA